MISGLAEALAFELLKEGATRLRDKLQGDEQQRALKAVAHEAFLEALKDISFGDVETVESELTTLLAHETTRSFLIDFALLDSIPTIADFKTIGADAISKPTLGVLQRFIPLFANGLIESASKVDSPLYNTVSIDRLERVYDATKNLSEDVSDVKGMLELILQFVQPEPKSTLQAETTGQILISYSRRDRDAVIQLCDDLESIGFDVWRDLYDIEGGELFWGEIKKGIDASETVVLCMSDDSLKSKYVQMEWQYARQQGKRVLPIVVNKVDFDKVPRWMSRVDWKDFREGQPEQETNWASFIRALNTPYEGRKVPFMAGQLPDYFVNRPEEFEKMVSALVDSNGAVAITAAVKGAGGFGKTTLALALCHDTRVRGAFDDGILWVTLGERPSQADLIGSALDLCALMTGKRPDVQNKEAVKTELSKAIGDRYVLLVIDDLWRKGDADIFMNDNPNSAVLITTRFDQMLPDKTHFKQNVDAMKTNEAVELLSWGIENIQERNTQALQNLTERLGEWAVIVRLANATLRTRIGRGDNLENALIYADSALTHNGLKAFDRDNESGRARAVQATIEVSLELLSEEQKNQFNRLAIFPEDVDIPFTTLEKMWDLSPFLTEQLLEALQDASLFQNYDLLTRTIRLHDVIRQYLIDTHKSNLQAWQAEFVNNLNIGQFVGENHVSPTSWDRALPDEYCWRNIAYHLTEAHQHDILRELLLEIDFLQAKLNHTHPNALIADCELSLSPPDTVGKRHASSLPPTDGNNDVLDNRPIELLRHALQLSSHIITNHPNQLPVQLVARLLSHITMQPDIVRLLNSIRNQDTPHLLSAAQTFDPASGALLRTLAGHTRAINSVCLSGEYAVSRSDDKTLKVWNLQTDELLRTLEGHTDTVNSVSLSDEFAVSASGSLFGSDETLKVWNWQTGELLTTFYADSMQFAVAIAPDFERIVCGGGSGQVHFLRPNQALMRILRGEDSS